MTMDNSGGGDIPRLAPRGGRFPEKIFVLYASQTGQAESISQYIYDQFLTGHLSPILDQLGSDQIQRHCLGSYEKLLLEQQEFLILDSKKRRNHQESEDPFYLAIFICSTTGQGDSPDKAIKFFRWIRRLKLGGGKLRSTSSVTSKRSRNKISSRSLKSSDIMTATTSNDNNNIDPSPFRHLAYALLGLGDTNYDNFANFGHLLDKLLLDLGATPYIPTAYADDAVGLELVTEPFIDQLSETLLSHFCSSYPDLKIMMMDKPATSISSSTSLKLPPSVNRTKRLQESSELSEQLSKLSFSQSSRDSRLDVSSCEKLTAEDRQRLNKFTNDLKESSEKLKSVEPLRFPATFKPVTLNLKSDESSKETVNIFEYLKKRTPSETTLYEAEIILKKVWSNLLSTENCLHNSKNILECEIRYGVPVQDNEEPEIDFKPGDSFGIYSSNNLVDVYQIMASCTILPQNLPEEKEEFTTLWDFYCKNPLGKLFHTLPGKNDIQQLELIPYLFYCTDLRAIPKKAALWCLAQYTGDEGQKRRLLELCSLDGNLEYQQYILNPKTNFCDILRVFDRCHPPVDVLLGHIPVAKPRYFSGASIPEYIKKNETNVENDCEPGMGGYVSVDIIFSIINNIRAYLKRSSENLFGLFSGKFYLHYRDVPNVPKRSFSDVHNLLQHVDAIVKDGSISERHDEVNHSSEPYTIPAYIFHRKNLRFRLSLKDFRTPLILISTGTGIAPFLSYLEVREQALSRCHDVGDRFGPLYFLHGCRHPDKDLIYGDRLARYARASSPPLFSHLCCCFSRCKSPESLELFANNHQIKLCQPEIGKDSKSPVLYKRVNDLVIHHGATLVDLIVNQNALVYICGDWKKISKELLETFQTILVEHHFKNLTLKDPEEEDFGVNAMKYLKQMEKEERYLQDIWS